MSLSNSLYEKIIKNNNICNHKEQLLKNKSKNKNYFYCYNCNNIILIIHDKIYSTQKLIIEEQDTNDKLEFDPISTIKHMIERQEEQIKYMNYKLLKFYSNNEKENLNENSSNNFNNNIDNLLNESEKINEFDITNNYEGEISENEKAEKKIKNMKSDLVISDSNSFLLKEKLKKNKKFSQLIFEEDSFNKYAKQRNKILNYIHKLCVKLKYNDNSFYLCLYLLDTYLSRIYSDEITERDLFLIVLGFFLISSKYIEDDIFEPELQIFCNIEKSINLSMDEIRASEVQCLNLINYNLYLYSAYDWLNTLLSNGILFENEIKDNKQIGDIYLNTQKLLVQITTKSYFFKYSSMEIAFSIIQISREKFLQNNMKFSEKLFKLLISLYGVEFSDYEECYNTVKQDLENSNSEEDENNITNSNTNSNTNINSITKANSNTNSNLTSIEIKKNWSNNNIINQERSIANMNTTERKNKFKLSLNSNKDRRYINTELNLKSTINNNKNKYKLYASPGQTNFSGHKKKYKSTDKKYEFLPNNSIGIFNNNVKNLASNILSNDNSIHNSSFKSTNYIPSESKDQLMIDCYRNDKQFFLTGKHEKSNNTLYINNAPKLFLKNTGTNINNINYINNININHKVINLYSGNKKKKMHKNAGSDLNFNFVYKINDNNNNKNNNNNIMDKENINMLKKSLFYLGNQNNGEMNYEYKINNINNINNININNKNKPNNNKSNNINIISSQNIISINNGVSTTYKTHKKMDPNKKEKYKTHLLLDITNNQNGNIIYNRNGNDKIIIPPERENRSCNKYTFNGYNNLIMDNNNNNHKKKKTFKIHLAGKNEIKVMNTNININLNNQLSSRKFTINFKDIVNKKINMERKNNFISKDTNNNTNNKSNNSTRFKSMNYNNYKNKSNKKNNFISNKSKNDKDKILVENMNNGINNKIFDKNKLLENKFTNNKNIAFINSKLPMLKLNKKSLLILKKMDKFNK